MQRRSLLLVFFLCFFTNSFASYILIPMDAKTQKNHLKAYGITYWLLEQNQKVKWLLNYRGGAFLVSDSKQIQNECLIRGVSYELISDSQTAEILEDIGSPSRQSPASRQPVPQPRHAKQSSRQTQPTRKVRSRFPAKYE